MAFDSRPTWIVSNRITGETRRYASLKAAYRAADAADAAYGAVICTVRRDYPVTLGA